MKKKNSIPLEFYKENELEQYDSLFKYLKPKSTSYRFDPIADFVNDGSTWFNRLDRYSDALEAIHPKILEYLNLDNQVQSQEVYLSELEKSSYYHLEVKDNPRRNVWIKSIRGTYESIKTKRDNLLLNIAEEELSSIMGNPKKDLDALIELFRSFHHKYVFQGKRLFSNCWVISSNESMAMWNNYTSKTGGIAVRIHFQDMIHYLQWYCDNTPPLIAPGLEIEKIIAGPVQYVDFGNLDKHLKAYENVPTGLLKDSSYSYENEFRILIKMREVPAEKDAPELIWPPGLKINLWSSLNLYRFQVTIHPNNKKNELTSLYKEYPKLLECKPRISNIVINPNY